MGPGGLMNPRRFRNSPYFDMHPLNWVCVIFLHPYIVYALSAARNGPLLHPNLIPAPLVLHWGVSGAQGTRHTP